LLVPRQSICVFGPVTTNCTGPSAITIALAGPNFASDILGTFFYRTFFGNQLQLGNPTMGAAVATTMFFIILAGVSAYLVILQRRMNRYTF